MTNAVIIPARYDSKRFPGKSLANISGKPMIEWVVNAACGSKLVNKIIVATDDKRIFDFIVVAGLDLPLKRVEAVMTSKDHRCGTDRIAEVVKKNPEIKFVVNLQGDEPLMPSEYINKVLESLLKSKLSMSSLVSPITTKEELENPNIVKAVMDKDGYALYFSRFPIPYDRVQNSSLSPTPYPLFFRHIGIYAFTRESLLQFSLLEQSPLEKIEQLEQLRALENGIKIKLTVVPKVYGAVDTKEDLKVVEKILKLQSTVNQ